MASFWACSYSGRKVGPYHETPTLVDISVSLGRICRYAGCGVRYWPVLLHSFVVADMLPERLKAYGLLHDATESVMGDVPRGFKTTEYSAAEKTLAANIEARFGLSPLTSNDERLVKLADEEALCGEVWTVGATAIQEYYPERSEIAEELVLEYDRLYPPMECIRPDGRAVIEYRKRVNDALREYRGGVWVN